MSVCRADRLSVRVGDEEHRSHVVERSEPLSLLVEVRTDLIDEDEDPFAPDEIHVPEKRLRVAQAGRPEMRVSIGGGGLRSTSLIVVWRRSSSSIRSLSSESFDHSPFSSRYFRIRSIGSRFAQVSTSSFDR